MSLAVKRSGAVMGALAFAAISSAETYVAELYNTQAPFVEFVAAGHADNAMMSGYVKEGGLMRAFYMTRQGYKNMHAAPYSETRINDSWGSTYHVGYGRLPNKVVALYWVGGGAPVSLHPAPYSGSSAQGGGGQLQAGTVFGPFGCAVCGNVQSHAGMWSRTASSFQRLHAPGYSYSEAVATDGSRFVGYCYHSTDNVPLDGKASLWTAPNTSRVNLHPAGAYASFATSIDGSQQGGHVIDTFVSSNRAVIWSGSVASMVSLHPSGVFQSSIVSRVRGGMQVGFGQPLNQPRLQAIAWHGKAATWINLHARLPIAFQTWSSFANGIDNLGNITGYIENPGGTDHRGVIWRRQ